jgi:hypothetical protein
MLSVTGQRGLWAAKIEGAASFLDSSMAEALAEFEGGGEALAGKLALAEPQVSATAEVDTVRTSGHVGSVPQLYPCGSGLLQAGCTRCKSV